jgi:uncharacterized DUF497 family protein
VDFALIAGFKWTSADIKMDGRFDYGELRKSAHGLIDGRLFVVVYTERGDLTRIISLRKANEREKRVFSTNAS